MSVDAYLYGETLGRAEEDAEHSSLEDHGWLQDSNNRPRRHPERQKISTLYWWRANYLSSKYGMLLNNSNARSTQIQHNSVKYSITSKSPAFKILLK